ncbi:MAG: CusA/CzcA family heavy metal efflux RND transporter [Candidatus Binatia bacterium]
MLERILRFSIRQRAAVVSIVAMVAALGLLALRDLPIDAVPDITNRQVQINATASSLSPVEVEKQVTFPIETALAGIPGLEYTRSFSRNGFAQVTAVFADRVDIYFARQQVAERLAATDDALPAETRTSMGPISTGLGEIVMWTVEYARSSGKTPVRVGEAGWQSDGAYLTPEGEYLRTDRERAGYLRTVQDWIIRPQLKSVPGVAEVDANGGYVKQYHVVPDVRALTAYGLSFHDVLTALERNNLSTGAGIVEHHGEAYVVRAAGRVRDLAGLAELPVVEREGVPVRIRDVADVVLGHAPRTGSATENGEEVVLGTALMLVGANSRTVATAVVARLAEVQASLPPDVSVRTVLDRSGLVDATIATVATNLTEGALLVIAVLFVMLGNIRAALITALAIPLSMLLTAIGMVQTKTSGNLMSLGAIDFGLIVDGAVIIVENCLRHLGDTQRRLGRTLRLEERLQVVFDATTEVRGATVFGEAIIVLVYVPILALTGVEGKMFHPMALTVIFALAAAFVLSLTFVPAMVAMVVRGPVREHENHVLGAVRRAYAGGLARALAWPRTVLVTAVALLVLAGVLFGRLGQEFAPTLSELDLVVMASRIPSTSLSEATAMQRTLERELVAQVPEAALIFSRTGTADVASDPMPPYLSDTFVMLKAREDWPNPGDTKEDVRERLEAVAATVPGNAYEFTQPIEMRFNELLAGVRGDLAVKVFGDDLEELERVASRIAAVLGKVPGAADVKVEAVEGAPILSVDVKREELARYGLSVADVHEVAAIAVGGRSAGEIYQGDRRFDVVVRLADAIREDPAALVSLPIPLSHEDEPVTRVALKDDDGHRFRPRVLPLGAVADLTLTEGPNQISRENGKRRVVVQANVRGRDIGSFVTDARDRIADEVRLPSGVWLRWGGQYESLMSARARLALVVPICLVLIVLLLYGTFGALRPALIVFTGVPLALIGGVLALWLRAMPFSISAAVGFIALSGVAVLNGLVLVTFINDLRAKGVAFESAIVDGALTRLRPVLMTALVASLGFLPMALGTGTGAEVQRPLATVVIGGLVSSTILTLFVLPVLYRLAMRATVAVRADGDTAW